MKKRMKNYKEKEIFLLKSFLNLRFST